jgi:hypothetical protein
MDRIVYLTIENDIRSARVTAVEHPHHQLYHVLFEDGYENMFFTDAETGNWIEEDLGETTLAEAVGAKLGQLPGVAAKTFKPLSWCRATIAGLVVNFAFYSYRQNESTVFEVYSGNRKFLCNLVKNKKGSWIMYGSYREGMEHQYTNQLHVIISLFEGMETK